MGGNITSSAGVSKYPEKTLYIGKQLFKDFSTEIYMTECVCLMRVSPATAETGSSHVPPMFVMQFVGSMAMVTTSHLMIRDLISMDCVNTHSYR